MKRSASISDLRNSVAPSLLHWSPKFPFRVVREQLCQSGFNSGQMVDVGHSDYATKEEAQAAAESWMK